MLSQLATHGYVAVPFDYDATEFIASLDEGTYNWFNERMTAKLGNDWTVDKTAIFNPSTETGRDALFLQRSNHADNATCHAIRFVLQGDSNMGLAAMHKSWSKAGFGKWVHITPGVGLQIAIQARNMLKSLDIPAIISGVPHVINKPPGGTELKPHTDGMPIKDLLQVLKDHLESADSSTISWTRKHGMQCLGHMEGGIDDGYTYSIGPMTPQILYICLTAVCDGRITGAIPFNLPLDKWMNGSDGPTFMNWKQCLPQFNQILEEANLNPIGVCPMVPLHSDGPILLFWPKHFPHGSAKNRKRRVSLTLPMNIDGPHLTEESRCIKRMKHLANLAHGTEQEKQVSEDWILNDTVPYYGGKTHKMPHLSGRWFRPGAPYHGIAPYKEEVEQFITELAL